MFRAGMRRGRLSGKPDEDARTRAEVGFERDLAVKPLDQLAADRKPQAMALDARVLVAGKAKERLKHRFQAIGGNSRPVVHDLYGPLVVPSRPLDANVTTL